MELFFIDKSDHVTAVLVAEPIFTIAVFDLTIRSTRSSGLLLLVMKEEARADSLIFSARKCSSRITTFDVPILGSVESVMCASSLVLF